MHQSVSVKPPLEACLLLAILTIGCSPPPAAVPAATKAEVIKKPDLAVVEPSSVKSDVTPRCIATGYRLKLVYLGGPIPISYPLAVFTPDHRYLRLGQLQDLLPYVHIKTKEDALEFVRIRTNPDLSRSMRDQAFELTAAKQSPNVKWQYDGTVEPEDYQLIKLFPKVTAVTYGFRVRRIMIFDRGSNNGHLALCEKTITPTSYACTELIDKRLSGLINQGWYIEYEE